MTVFIPEKDLVPVIAAEKGSYTVTRHFTAGTSTDYTCGIPRGDVSGDGVLNIVAALQTLSALLNEKSRRTRI